MRFACCRNSARAPVRDEILALADDDRKRLDQQRLGKWVRTYVNHWGQVPQAPSRSASAAHTRRLP